MFLYIPPPILIWGPLEVDRRSEFKTVIIWEEALVRVRRETGTCRGRQRAGSTRLGSQWALKKPAKSNCLRDVLPEGGGRRKPKRFSSTLLPCVVRAAPRRAVWANNVASCDQSSLSKEMPVSQVEGACRPQLPWCHIVFAHPSPKGILWLLKLYYNQRSHVTSNKVFPLH